ncbi:MAG: hypothetical protein HWE25_07880 [Alphaproteobacteria bacterium]|nr:hypothetical protein [Alphaproteobacteria bacterium]
MLGYVKYGGYAIFFGWLIYKIWDRFQSHTAIGAIRNLDWLTDTPSEQRPEEISKQELYDFAQHYIGMLRGVFSHPSRQKLDELNNILKSPHNLHDQLWYDMMLKLAGAYQSYPPEYRALVATIIQKSQNQTQLYAAFRLASCFEGVPWRLSRRAERLEKSGAIESAQRKAASLR